MDPAAVRALVNYAKEVADLNTEANALIVEFIAEQKRLEAEIKDLRATRPEHDLFQALEKAHADLARLRAVLQEVRPLVKGRLLDLDGPHGEH